jgi:hypothetical protein
VGRDLQRFQRFDVEAVVNSARQLRADARYRAEEAFRIEFTAQSLELGPAARDQHFDERGI